MYAPAHLTILSFFMIGCMGPFLTSCGAEGNSGSNASFYKISGTISGAVVPRVTVSLNTLSTKTNASGNYAFPYTVDGSYTITPKLRGYVFTPPSRSVQVAGANVTGQDFVAAPAPLSLSTFQLASLVIGQADFVSGSMNRRSGPGANTLNYVYGDVALDGSGRLFLADSNNCRVLGYDAFPANNGASADFVLGQLDFTSDACGTATGNLYMPQDVRVADGRLYVSDENNARILIYNTIPTATGALPDVVIGWANSYTPRRGCTQDELTNPFGLAVAGGKIIVADGLGNRVLIWNSIPTVDGAPADVVLGQKDFTHCAANDETGTDTTGSEPSARTMYDPTGVWSDGTKLLVADELNNRVLIWNSIPTVSQTPADLVLGQPDFVSSVNGTSRGTFTFPAHVASDGAMIAVSDVWNNRVLGWNAFPTDNGVPADFVLGQSDFVHSVANDDNQDGVQDADPSARTFNSPHGLTILPGMLIVADSHNFRFLVFDGP